MPTLGQQLGHPGMVGHGPAMGQQQDNRKQRLLELFQQSQQQIQQKQEELQTRQGDVALRERMMRALDPNLPKSVRKNILDSTAERMQIPRNSQHFKDFEQMILGLDPDGAVQLRQQLSTAADQSQPGESSEFLRAVMTGQMDTVEAMGMLQQASTSATRHHQPGPEFDTGRHRPGALTGNPEAIDEARDFFHRLDQNPGGPPQPGDMPPSSDPPAPSRAIASLDQGGQSFGDQIDMKTQRFEERFLSDEYRNTPLQERIPHSPGSLPEGSMANRMNNPALGGFGGDDTIVVEREVQDAILDWEQSLLEPTGPEKFEELVTSGQLAAQLLERGNLTPQGVETVMDTLSRRMEGFDNEPTDLNDRGGQNGFDVKRRRISTHEEGETSGPPGRSADELLRWSQEEGISASERQQRLQIFREVRDLEKSDDGTIPADRAEITRGRIAGFAVRDTRAGLRFLDQVPSIPHRLVTQFIPGTPAHSLRSRIDSLRATIGIGELLAIKEADVGLGHIPQAQLEMVADLLGQVRMSLNTDELRDLLFDIEDNYLEILQQMSPEGRERVGIAKREMDAQRSRELWQRNGREGQQQQAPASRGRFDQMSDEDLEQMLNELRGGQ